MQCAGGGGYGTNGNCSYPRPEYNAFKTSGKIYGDKEINVLHLGSGGGGGINNIGGAGGGAIRIRCFGDFILKSQSCITCNGEASNGDGGSGSGGSIHIIIPKTGIFCLEINSYIYAVGGNHNRNLNNGNGRICIQCQTRLHRTFKGYIYPRPYYM